MDVLDPRDEARDARTALRAWLAVQRAFALAPEKLPAAIRTVADPSPLLAEHAIDSLGRGSFESTLEALARHHVRLVPISSALYPERIARLIDAPPVLAVRGNPALLRVRGVAIVGARAATRYGRRVASELAREFARAGLAVVSGLARGIDAAAHEGALAAGGATLGFSACGPERVYPAEHRALAGRVIERGALVTEFPIGTPPRAPYFPLRNRLISGMSEAVVVVEARIRSGSLTTARHAANQGVEVWAVPGELGKTTSEGPLLLLREGAGLVTEARDVLEAIGLAEPQAASDAPAPAPPPGDPLQRQVWALLRREPQSLDELSQGLEVPPGPLAAAVAALEVDGRVLRDRDGRFTTALP